MVADAPDSAPSTVDVDSRWWYWIAASPVAIGLAFLVSVAVFVTVLAGVLARGGQPPGVDPLPGPSHGVWVEPTLGPLALAALAAVGTAVLVVVLVCPLAMYRDATVIAREHGEWQPDPVFWAVVGGVGVFVTALQFGGAVYYLWRRHRAVGVP
ncbi:MAG: hypothetical protein ABEJ42_04570 [Halobacteriaceae archaeon]